MAVPDEAHEADRAAVHQRNAPAPTEDAEHGVLGRDAEVAPGGELETARDGVPLDRRDDGLAEEHPRRPHRTVPVRRDAAHARRVIPHRLQVGPGAELPVRAGEDRDGERLVGIEAAESVGQRLGGGPVDGVGHFGAIDRDHGDRPVHTVAYAHAAPPSRM